MGISCWRGSARWVEVWQRAAQGLRLSLCALALCTLALCALALAASAQAGESGDGKTATRAGEQLPPLELSIDPARVELGNGQLELKTSRPAVRVTVKVLDASGKVLAEVEQRFEGTRAHQPLTVRWGEVESEQIARIEVHAYDKDDYFKGIAITPWSFRVPHEDVVFDTDSAKIRESEVPKLRASSKLIRTTLEKYHTVGAIRLFVAAHTDTRGSKEHNRALSLRRARAISEWFRQNGLRLPIAYQGFGEQALKVVTPDEVDEIQNRRADYMLSIDPPHFKVSGSVLDWQTL